jgi:hypothetical protein
MRVYLHTHPARGTTEELIVEWKFSGVAPVRLNNLFLDP